MYTVIRRDNVELEHVPHDVKHSGTCRSAFRTVYRSDDDLVHLGYWEFEGEVHAMPDHGYGESVTVLDGSFEIDYEGETLLLKPGDTIVYESPIGEKHIRSSGFRAVYVVKYDAPVGVADP